VRSQKIKTSILLLLAAFSVSVFAANPSQPFLPSDNVQDPNCTPADSNCYVSSAGISNGGDSFGTTLTLGTNDNNALQFETNNATAMTILPNGNIGIGTSTPDARLTVQSSGITNTASIKVLGTPGASDFMIFERGTDSQNGLMIGRAAPNATQYVNASFIRASGSVNDNLELGPGKSLAGVMGYISIGTNGRTNIGNSGMPMAVLHVGSSTPYMDLFRVDGLGGAKLSVGLNGNVAVGNTSGAHALDVYGDCIALMGTCIGTSSPTNVVEYVGDTYQYSEDATVGAALTRYLTAAGGTIGATDIISVVVTRNGVFKNFYVRADGNTLTGNSTFEVLKNGTATGFSVVLPAGMTSASNISSSVGVEAGDRISLRLITDAGTGTVSRPQASFEHIVSTSVFSTSQWVTATSSANIYYETGNVSIGTSTTPTDRLQVIGDIRVGASSTDGCIKNFAGTGITGTCSSDERLKTEVTNFNDGTLDKILKIKAVSYKWNDLAKSLNNVNTEVTNYGLIAQNVEDNFPELVSTDANGYKQIDYSRIQLYLLKAIQELAKKVMNLTESITTNRLKTQELCVDDICITKEQFRNIIQQTGTGYQTQNSAPIESPVADPVVIEVASSTEPEPEIIDPVEPVTPSEEPVPAPVEAPASE